MTEVGCSARSAAVDEPTAGTSPYALGWVALEQDGPWGARALTQSHLDPRVGRALEEASAANDVRPALIRRPGRRAHPPTDDRRRHVLVAHTRPGSTWLLEGTVEDPAELLGLDLAAVRAGDERVVRRTLPALQPARGARLLVCTNGRRDACCAVAGRPVALGAATSFPEQVWETTHTSGHRFAATAVLLPAGTLHGRLDVAAAAGLLHAAERGHTVLEGSRGRCTWPIEAQAAELAVREQERVLDLDALEVLDRSGNDDGSWLVHVRHADGRGWRVRVTATVSESSRPESCGKGMKPVTWLTAVVRAGGRGQADGQ
jgi:hypothetical protein